MVYFDWLFFHCVYRTFIPAITCNQVTRTKTISIALSLSLSWIAEVILLLKVYSDRFVTQDINVSNIVGITRNGCRIKFTVHHKNYCVLGLGI